MQKYTSVRVTMETKQILDRLKKLLEALYPGQRWDMDAIIRKLAVEELGVLTYGVRLYQQSPEAIRLYTKLIQTILRTPGY